MEAIRCKQCGDVRWSIRGFGDIGEIRCELCGGEMTAERRQPHTHRFAGATERRAGDFARRRAEARTPTTTTR